MKILFSSIFFFLSFLGPNLPEIRNSFIAASETKEQAQKLSIALESVTKKSTPILIAYKGAAATLQAKYSKGIKQKKEYFKQGVAYLEFAIEKAPKNIEIRCLRLSVQEHSPKILKYKKNISADKQFLLDHYKQTKSSEVRKFVRKYVAQSSLFDSNEKKLF